MLTTSNIEIQFCSEWFSCAITLSMDIIPLEIDRKDTMRVYIIQSTLWFLAKYGCVCDEIMFYNSLTIDRLWEETDLFITCDIDVINARPDNKKLIIVDKIYNKDMICNKRIDNLKEIESLEYGCN